MPNFRLEGFRQVNGINMPFDCLIENQLEHMNPVFLPDDDPNKKEWPLHYHEYMELIYILDNSVLAFVGNECFTLNPDDLLIIFPNEPHRFISINGQGFRYGVMKFFTDIVNVTPGENEFEYIYNLNNSEHTRIFHSFDCVKNAFLSAASAFSNHSYGFDLATPGYILQVCSEIFNKWHLMNEIFSINAPKQNIAVFYELMKRVNESCGRLTASEAAEFWHFSYGYFARTFKSIFRTDYKNYSRRIKIDEAKRLLLCTDNTVTQIAADLGYSSASHFIKDFKLVTNVSPKQYRTDSKLATS